MSSIELTASQYSKKFWFEAFKLPLEEQVRYHIYGIFHYQTAPDFNRLQHALQVVVNTHYNLRSNFEEKNGELIQIIHDHVPVIIDFYTANTALEFQQILDERLAAPFNLANGPLFRFACIQNNSNQTLTFVPNFHHIIIDGTQFDDLMKEIGQYYHEMPSSEQTDKEAIADLQEYIAWESEQIAKADVNYWVDKVKNYPLTIDLRYQSQEVSSKHKELAALYRLDENLYQRLNALSETSGSSVFDILKTTWALLISQYSNQQKVIITYPFNTRRKNFKHIKGAFLNTWLFNFDRKDTFTASLEAQKKDRQSIQHRYANIVDILLQLKESAFTVSISQADLAIDGPILEETPDYNFKIGLGSSDLCLFFNTKNSIFQYGLVASEKLFNNDSLDQLSRHFCCLLSKILDNPSLDLMDLSCVSTEEYNRITCQWNKYDAPYPVTQNIVNLFEEQVTIRPHNTALIYQDSVLSYQRLNEKANQLAHRLRKEYYALTGEELTGDTLIPLCIERNFHLIIAILGILKAGAGYVPIDASYPANRIQFMLEDISAKLIISDQCSVEKITTISDRIKVMLIEETSDHEDNNNLKHQPSPDHLAYVLYTSGTTGHPKGVMVQHNNVVSLVKNVNYFEAGEPDTFALFSDIAFDAATFEIWGALLNGAKLFIPDNRLDLLSSSILFKQTIQKEKITLLWLTKIVFDLLFLQDEKLFATIKYLLIGGEALNKQLISGLVASSHKPQHIINGYGPTENTTFSLTYLINNDINHLKSIPIGVPLSNRRAYVLDQHLQPSPIGVAGELYVGGAGLARGYLNLDALTEERFIKNPFAEPDDKSNSRLYKTQDLVRWLPDGNLEYLGRTDFQVKLRGYRIELGAIEATLMKYPCIDQSVVVFNGQNNHSHLVGYYVAPVKLDAEEMRTYLALHLPDYMIPAFLVHLPHLPLLTNGKLNRKSLPEPQITQNHLKKSIAPRHGLNDIERKIAMIWSGILKIDPVPPDVSFFNLGGNSLAVMLVKKELEDAFHIKMNIVDLFEHVTLNQLSNHISSFLSVKTEAKTLTEENIQDGCSDPMNESIAIVGMACRAPDIDGPESFWDLLMQERSNLQDFSDNELRTNHVNEDLIINDSFVKRGSVLKSSYDFDAGFFEFSAKDAELMDPQQRQFLECSWEALEYSGNIPEKYHGEIGVFASQGKNHYYIERILPNPEYRDKTNAYQTMLGNEKDFLSTKVSFKLNLSGPSINVQTGCSSSLVSVHMACESLKTRSCDMALAGGVSLFYQCGYVYQEGMIESPDGYCRPFDADAKGTIAGSGVAVVVLKRLSDAIEQKDTIYAVIKGNAINNDGGAKIGYTAPSVTGQAAAIEKALKKANVPPATIHYIEAHGTGTVLGDPIEWKALHNVYQKYTSTPHFCKVGSVKSNIGHTDSAAGVFGLIKAALSLKNKVIPATLHFNHLNPEIASFNTLFQVCNKTTIWEASEHPRRAAVSSFGIGGTNAHFVLEEWDENPSEKKSGGHEQDNDHYLIPFSARSQGSLFAMANRLKKYLESDIGSAVHDIAFTAQTGRAEFSERGYFIVQSCLGKRSIKQSWLRDSPGLYKPEVLLVLSEPQPSSLQPDYTLFKQQPLFYEYFNQCALFIRQHYQIDIADGDSVKQDDPNHGLTINLINFALQYSMAKLFIALVPHSCHLTATGSGAFVGAAALEVFSLEDAISLFVTHEATETFVSDIPCRDGADFEKVPVISSQTGIRATEVEIQTAAFWLSLSKTRLCSEQAIAKANATNNCLFVVIGNAQVLDHRNLMATSICTEKKPCSLPAFLEVAGWLWSHGVPLLWDKITMSAVQAQKIPLPTYPFIKRRYELAKTIPVFNSTGNLPEPLNKTGSIEDRLKTVWADSLGIPASDITHASHFFRLGGDSLALVDLMHGIKKSLTPHVSLEEISTLCEFGELLHVISTKSPVII